eukprot:CAMPEP_0182559622 /NCGR_PEP_ID=MMETSP1324-20130603/2673_1 /TAXON_ID=236786 /ORGANISM="Florenciella sp., Strain RCC1587" /LENGTH=690 /DNA_ID=CAMNT_0024771903 /DNA_START=68 /DNA_END=2140 /DNA_ORIENTATION=+
MGRIGATTTTMVVVTAGMVLCMGVLLWRRRPLQNQTAGKAANKAAGGKADADGSTSTAKSAPHGIPLKERIAVIRTLVTMSQGSIGHRGMPFAIVPELQHEAALEWRLNYRSFRRGRARGADNEGVALMATVGRRGSGASAEATTFLKRSGQSRLRLDQDAAAADAGALAIDSNVSSTREELLERLKMEVNAWRLDYRRHRTGGAKGAKGEASAFAAKLTMHHIRLLPASQAANLRSGKIALKRAESMKSNSPYRKNRQHGQTASSAVAADGSALEGDHLHVHFGAGRLGMGLILPAIARSNVKLVIVQRPSGAFKELNEGGSATVDLVVNGSPHTSLTLVKAANDIPSSWLDDPAVRGLFVLSDDSELIGPLVTRANTFSTSLGPGIKGLGKVLNAVPVATGGAAFEQRPAVFCGENDHDAVDALGEEMAKRVDTVGCMVDRICTSRTITATTVEVEAEPYGGAIVVLCPPPHVAAPPFVGDENSAVLVPRIQSQADYLCRRKLLMVNGMHTVLAFMTLCKAGNASGGTRGALPLTEDKLQSPASDLVLTTLKTASKTEADVIWHWAVARCLLLLFEYDLDVMKDVHDCEHDSELCTVLLKYAKQTVERFSTARDTCGRVLGGGVTNRYKGRLAPVNEFLSTNLGPLDACSAKLIKMANVKLSEVVKSVAHLTAEAGVFAGVTPDAQDA